MAFHLPPRKSQGLCDVPPNFISNQFSSPFPFCFHNSSCFSWRIPWGFGSHSLWLECCSPDTYLASCLQVSLFKSPFSLRPLLSTLLISANCTKPSGNQSSLIQFHIFTFLQYAYCLFLPFFLGCKHLENRDLYILCTAIYQEIRLVFGIVAHNKYLLYFHK